jgi:hypothetical protein
MDNAWEPYILNGQQDTRDKGSRKGEVYPMECCRKIPVNDSTRVNSYYNGGFRRWGSS